MKSIVAGLAVLLIHSAAQAQQPYYPAQPYAYPPGYGPPPGFVAPMGPPPVYVAPRPYFYRPAPVYYPAAPVPMPVMRRPLTWRPFTLAIGGGGGYLSFADDQGNGCRGGGGALTARLGFGLANRLILIFDFEYTGMRKEGLEYGQAAELIGLQAFLGNRLFIKGGAGAAQNTIADPEIPGSAVTMSGGALMGGIGFELLQGWNWSLAAEWSATLGFYERENWISNGFNVVLNFY